MWAPNRWETADIAIRANRAQPWLNYIEFMSVSADRSLTLIELETAAMSNVAVKWSPLLENWVSFIE